MSKRNRRMGMPAGGGAGNLMKQAQQMQQKIMQLQQELEEKTQEFESGGGAVKVLVNGRHELLELNIDPEVVLEAEEQEDVEMLQDLILAAVNGAFKKVSETTEQEMSKVAGGLPLGGLFG